MFEFYRLLPRL